MNILLKFSIVLVLWSLHVNLVFGKGCDSERITLADGINITWPKTFGKFE